MSGEYWSESGVIVPLSYILRAFDDDASSRLLDGCIDLGETSHHWCSTFEESFLYEVGRWRLSLQTAKDIKNLSQKLEDGIYAACRKQSHPDENIEMEKKGPKWRACVREAFSELVASVVPEAGWDTDGEPKTFFFEYLLEAALDFEMPQLAEMRFFHTEAQHGGYDSIGGLLLRRYEELAEQIPSSYPVEELCFIFEESSCFDLVPKPQAEQFAKILKVSELERSIWVNESWS